MRTTKPISSVQPLLLLVVSALGAACSPPSGPDFVSYTCLCSFPASGGTFPISARICTDVTDEDKLRDDAQSQCDAKETVCFPSCPDPIENCGFVADFTRIGVCPEGSNPQAGGDLGQARSVAAPGSLLMVTGDDVDDFDVVPDTLVVQTTQDDGTLRFADIAGFVSAIDFSTPGGFLGIGGGDHSLDSVHLVLTAPFTVPLAADGTFSAPAGAGNLVVSGVLDGDETAVGGTTSSLSGIYDEELGLFTMEGSVSADGADIEIGFAFALEFENRPPRADAGPDQNVECSSTDGTGVASMSALGSFDLDGNGDIAVYRWLVDFESDPMPTEFVGAEVPIALELGSHVITLTVADQSGSSGVDQATVVVEDTTAPTIAIGSPEAIQYEHTALITLDYDAADACVGVADSTTLLDGAETLAGHGLQSGQVIDLLLELPLGPHTLSIEAVDELGQASTASVTFEVIATAASLKLAVERFAADGLIARDGITEALLRKLAAAAAAENNCETAANIYGAFVEQVEALAGKSIDPRAAAILVADAQFVAASCS